MATQKKNIQCDHCGATVLELNIVAHKRTSKCVNLEQPKPLEELLYWQGMQKVVCPRCGSVGLKRNLSLHMTRLKCQGFKPL